MTGMFALVCLLLSQANMRFATYYSLIHRPRISQSIRPGHSRIHIHNTNNNEQSATADGPRTITVIGGGLAGLAVTYHLLKHQSTFTRIRVIDQAGVGEAGASSVAGGLLHPLSPRGKIVYKGLDGIRETNVLLEAALAHQDENTIVLRDRLYRVAMTEKQAETFQKTAEEIPDICNWISETDMKKICNSNEVYGGLLLKNGCKVIDVPSYLRGLWKACQSVAEENKCHLSWTQDTTNEWHDKQDDETIVYAAGSGLFEAKLLDPYVDSFPVQLVHGQSLVLRYQDPDCSKFLKDALLCGKYISPLSDPDLVLVGSTHEFKDTLLPQSEVIRELRERTATVAPDVWQQCVVDNITKGTRVQSERGRNGRLPILGKLPGSGNWIFTGLSSRGLLYHAMYGKILANAILKGSEDYLVELDDEILWWKTKTRRSTR